MKIELIIRKAEKKDNFALVLLVLLVIAGIIYLIAHSSNQTIATGLNSNASQPIVDGVGHREFVNQSKSYAESVELQRQYTTEQVGLISSETASAAVSNSNSTEQKQLTSNK